MRIETLCHLVVGSVGKVGWIHLVFALGAGETLPVVAPWLRNLLLGLKHFSRASRADICLTLLPLKLAAIRVVQVCLGLVPVRVRVAVLAIDLGSQWVSDAL